MGTLSGFRRFADELEEQDIYMPVLFVGHGSPTNALEDNEFSIRWRKMGQELPVPKAVLVVSAHWLTKGTHITAMPQPKTIHDFGGFSRELYEVQYPAPGSPELAKETSQLIKSTNVGLDHDWGLDHGAWSVVKHMYPDANIPVLQLSIDYHKPAQYHYELAKELMGLRKKGVLILGSGNMVHNLGMIAVPGGDFSRFNEEYGYDWAHEMNTIFKDKIANRDHKALIEYEKLNKSAKLAVPTPDHYYPLLYALGLQRKNEDTTFFNDKAVGGAFTMTSVKIA
ncbi:MAG: 4,5-DOPA dioxygenase extradiol [Chitinophagales bacterium]|nr:4,5-DOPA dioxygenase extradiol [Chitinophagales bacterium]